MKIIRDASKRCTTGFGLSFDSADNMTIFIGYIPGANLIYDLPPLRPPRLELVRDTVGAPDLDPATLEWAEQRLTQGMLFSQANQARARRGVKSRELLTMLEQQLKLLFNASFSQFCSEEEW